MGDSRFGVLAFALAVFGAISLFARLRSTRTAVDFQLAGQRVGVITNACAICGDYVSAASFLGVAATVYGSGLDGVWFPVGFAAGFVPVLLLVAAPLRRFGERSIPDFLGRRFESEALRLLSVIVVEFIIIVYLIPQSVGSGLSWDLLVGWALPGLSAYSTGIVVSTVVIASLVVIGGMRGTTWNQAFQFVLLLFILLWLAIAIVADGFSYAGSVGEADAAPLTVAVETVDGAGVLAEVPNARGAGAATFGQPGARYGAVGHFALIVAFVMATSGLPHVMNRYFTSPSGRAARTTTVWVLALVGLFYALAVMLGTAARTIIAEKAPTEPWLAELTVDGVLRVPDQAMLALGRLYGAETGLSVVTTGALIAIMSTIAGLLLAASASWGFDVYERHINPRATRQQALRAGQGAVLFVALVSAVVGVLLDPSNFVGETTSVVTASVTAALAIAGSSLTPALICAIWWKGSTASGIAAGVIVGSVIAVGSIVFWLIAADPGPVWLTPTFVAAPASILTTVVVSRRGTAVDSIDEIWIRMHGTARDRQLEAAARATVAATRS